MKELTKAEEQVMQALWQLEEAFVKEVIELLPEPKPAYNTVSTIIRILEKKEFIGHKAYGRSYKYHPLISKEDYQKFATEKVMTNYFSGSFEHLLSFFVKEKKLDVNELEDILNKLKEEK